jgi:hypothetical protein
MSSDLMKKPRFGKRQSPINRFNIPSEESDFLRIFQIAMSEKMMLMECGEFDRDKFQKFLYRKLHRDDKKIGLKVKPLLLSCKVDPNFYLDIQEAAKEMFGECVPMNELISFLLDYFARNYGREDQSEAMPLFVRKYWGRSKINLNRLQAKFGPYFKNHIVSFRT